MLAYDVSSPKSFQDLIEFCARCELGGVGIAPGTSLPCLVVGLKGDLAGEVQAEDGWRLARRLGGRFMTCSAKTGEGFPEIVEAAVTPVIDARTRLIRESEETLGAAVRELLLSGRLRRRRRRLLLRRIMPSPTTTLRKKLSVCARRTPTEARRPPPQPQPQPSQPSQPPSRAWRCSGAPPRWTMRELVSPPPLRIGRGAGPSSGSGSESGDSDAATLVDPCPPEFQLPADLLEPASTGWEPEFDLIMEDVGADEDVRGGGGGEASTSRAMMRWTI